MISVQALTHRYGALTAVEDLSFELGRGELLGLLGPNGAGKSTTMRALVGLLTPSAGSIRIGEADMARDPLAARRQIGYLPEQVPLYRELKVREFLGFAAAVKGVRGADRPRELERVTALCGLESVMNRLIGYCSRGYRQRIGLAQALVGDPPVLVLDEPTVGLDPEQVAGIRERIQELARDKAVILSTHMLGEAQRICTRVLILRQGRCVAQDSPAHLGEQAGAPRWLAILRSAPPDLERQLAGFAPLAGVQRLGLFEDRTHWQFELRSTDAAPDLLAELLRAGCAVEEFSAQRAGLEEIFLRVIHGEQPW